MTDIANTITSIATLVTAIGAVIIGFRNSGKIDEAKTSIAKSVDGVVDKLVVASKAQGAKEERDNPAPAPAARAKRAGDP
jgi:hypothetical protein